MKSQRSFIAAAWSTPLSNSVAFMFVISSRPSQSEPGVLAKHCQDCRQQIRVHELYVIPTRRPDADDAEGFPALEPKSNLLDRRVLDVQGQRALAGRRRGAGKDVAAGVGNTRDAVSRAER